MNGKSSISKALYWRGECKAFLIHVQGLITRAVAAMDSCFALFGVHQHGIAVTRHTYERKKQYIKGPLLTRREQSIHLSASSTKHMAATARLCGMDFISDDDAKTDLVQQPLVINGEETERCRESGQQLGLRCITRRLVIEPQCEAVALVHLIHPRSSSKASNQGL